MSHVIRRPGLLGGAKIPVFLALVHAVNDVLTALLGALLPTLQARFGAPTTTLAVLVAALSVSSSVTQPFLGALAERVGLRLIAAGGVALAAVAFSLVGVADSVGLLILLLLLGGIGSAALHPVSTSIVGGPDSRNPGLAVGLFTAGGMAGFAAGPVLTLYLIAVYGVGVSPWLMVPGLVLAVAMLALLPEWEPHTGRPRSRRLGQQLLTGQMVLLTGAATLVSLAFITFTSAIPLWLVTKHGVETDAPLLGWTLGLFSLAAGLGAVAGGLVAARLGFARTTALSLLAVTPPLLATLWLPVGAATLVSAAVAGALIYASQPLLIVAAQKAVPGAPAAGAGVVIGVGHALAGLLYIPVGALQGVIGLEPAIAMTFLLAVPAAVLGYRAFRVAA